MYLKSVKPGQGQFYKRERRHSAPVKSHLWTLKPNFTKNPRASCVPTLSANPRKGEFNGGEIRVGGHNALIASILARQAKELLAGALPESIFKCELKVK